MDGEEAVCRVEWRETFAEHVGARKARARLLVCDSI